MGIFALALALQAAGQVFNQPATGDRLVVMEAENFNSNVTVGGKTWTLMDAATVPAAPAGFVVDAMAVPNADTANNTDATTFVNGPRLNFRVLFRFAGTHSLWIRGRAIDPTVGANDSCHVAINGIAAAGGFQMTGWVGTDWRWSRSANGVNATIVVPSVGVHTISLIMREDGFMADRILLSSNAAYAGLNTNTVEGPAQTATIADQTPAAATAPTLTPGVLSIRATWAAVANADTYLLQRSENGGAFATIFSGNALTYNDTTTGTTSDYCYRVQGVDSAFGAGPVSPASCARALLPPPRTADHEEGFLGDNCACGATAPGGPAAAWLLGVLLLTLRRRR